MAVSGKKKILYFVKGTVVSDDERQAALRVGTLMFRSLEGFSDHDFIEECDGVAGCPPKAYSDRFPSVDKAKVEPLPAPLPPAQVQPSPPPPPAAVVAPPPPPPPSEASVPPWK